MNGFSNFPNLKRVLPPSLPIQRKNEIEINAEQFHQWLDSRLDVSHPQFKNNIGQLLNALEKIRLAVQSNLGLSAIQRDKHETYQALWIKKGADDFPIEQDGTIKEENILFDDPKHTALIIKDNSGMEGLSILYKTKFRSFKLHISADGKVNTSLTLNWEAIYADLAPEVPGQQQAIRSFTPWQRHSEANFFNARSTDKILSYLAKSYPSVYSFNCNAYYRDGDSATIRITSKNASTINTSKANLYLQLDDSAVEMQREYRSGYSILAVIKRKSPLIGELYQIVPCVYSDEKLHLVIHGHQQETEIQDIFSCDFTNNKIIPWKLKKKINIINSDVNKQYKWLALHLLQDKDRRDLIQHTSAAPMVRASDVAMRKFWISSYDIPTVYTEMITLADLFNTADGIIGNPQEWLENIYYNDRATSGFRRFCVSGYELEHASHVVFQVVLPHESINDDFFWGQNGEHIARTLLMLPEVIYKMIPPQFKHKIRLAVNMCCPAASIEKMGAGFGLRNKPEYIEQIVRSIKQKYPDMEIEFKTLMLSEAETNQREISFAANKELAENLSKMGADGLVWQAKPRNNEEYNLSVIADILNATQVNSDFKFGYSGMVASLLDQDLYRLGYSQLGNPHHSVEEVLRKHNCEVMLGRVLLGSAWLLEGHYASDAKILLFALLQSLLLRENTIGAGPFGIDLMQIHILYNVRHIIDDVLRNNLIKDILIVKSAEDMIAVLGNRYLQQDDLNSESLIKPSIIKLKTAIKSATNGLNLFSRREQMLEDHVILRDRISAHFPEARPANIGRGSRS